MYVWWGGVGERGDCKHSCSCLLGDGSYHLWRERLPVWHHWGTRVVCLFLSVTNHPGFLRPERITSSFQTLGKSQAIKSKLFTPLILSTYPSSDPEIYNFTLWKVLWKKRMVCCETDLQEEPYIDWVENISNEATLSWDLKHEKDVKFSFHLCFVLTVWS